MGTLLVYKPGASSVCVLCSANFIFYCLVPGDSPPDRTAHLDLLKYQLPGPWVVFCGPQLASMLYGTAPGVYLALS